MWKLLTRYLTGECSEREQEEVQAAIAVDEERGELLEDLTQVWEAAGASTCRADAAAAWSKLDDRIRQDAVVKPLRVVSAPSERTDRMRYARPTLPLLRLAAAFAVLLITTLFAVRWTEQPVRETPLAEEEVFTTREGQRATVRLRDGTEVRLNVGSELLVPTDFGVDEREVVLRGHAYFDVARDEGHPFRVRTELATVQVLGTAFDVQAYPGQEQVQVAVAEGQVALRANRHVAGDTLVLRPRDLGIVSGEGLPAVWRDVNLSRYLAWLEGRLVFENAPFHEVAAELERWYDLQVSFVGSPAEAHGLTASFSEEPLSEILNAISAALNLRYERNRRQITFFPAAVGTLHSSAHD